MLCPPHHLATDALGACPCCILSSVSYSMNSQSWGAEGTQKWVHSSPAPLSLRTTRAYSGSYGGCTPVPPCCPCAPPALPPQLLAASPSTCHNWPQGKPFLVELHRAPMTRHGDRAQHPWMTGPFTGGGRGVGSTCGSPIGAVSRSKPPPPAPPPPASPRSRSAPHHRTHLMNLLSLLAMQWKLRAILHLDTTKTCWWCFHNWDSRRA